MKLLHIHEIILKAFIYLVQSSDDLCPFRKCFEFRDLNMDFFSGAGGIKQKDKRY